MANITNLLERVKDAALDLIGYRVKSSGKEEKEIKKSLRNVSGCESDKKLQGNTDDLHTIRLKVQLWELGVPTHKQENIIQELLKNGKTGDLVHIQMHILDQQTYAQVRLSLTGREDDKNPFYPA